MTIHFLKFLRRNLLVVTYSQRKWCCEQAMLQTIYNLLLFIATSNSCKIVIVCSNKYFVELFLAQNCYKQVVVHSKINNICVCENLRILKIKLYEYLWKLWNVKQRRKFYRESLEVSGCRDEFQLFII